MKKLVGILILAACLVGFTMPAGAANMDNFSFSGKVGIFTGWTHSDDVRAGGESKTDLRWTSWESLELNSKYETDRFTANLDIDTDDEAFGTPSPLDVDEDDANNPIQDLSLYFDTATAKVDFDAFSIKIGYDNPLSFNPGGDWRDKYTETWVGKTIGGSNNYQVNFIFPVAKGMKFDFLLGGPTTDYADKGGASSTEITLPLMEAAFTGYKPFMWKVYGGYQTYEATYAGVDKDIDSYIAGAMVAPSFGPLNSVLSVAYSTNQYLVQGPGPSQVPALGPYSWNWSPDSDTSRIGIMGSVMYNINEMFAAAFTAGYQKFEADGNYEDSALGYGVSFPIHLTDIFSVRPYCVVNDWDTVTTEEGGEQEQGKTTDFGVYWEAKF